MSKQKKVLSGYEEKRQGLVISWVSLKKKKNAISCGHLCLCHMNTDQSPPWWTPTFCTSVSKHTVPTPPHTLTVILFTEFHKWTCLRRKKKNSLKCKWQRVCCQEPSVAEHQLFCLSASSTNKSTVCSLLAGEHCDTILSITLHGDASFAWLWVIHQINTTYT